MTPAAPRGISREGLNEDFAAEEAEKTQLFLKAQLLRARGHAQEAADRFAEAAEIEEHLFERCQAQGLREKAGVHGFSAASAWARAGNFYRAITWCSDLLEAPELSELSRREVSEYRALLQGHRAQWYAELNLASAAVEK